MRDLFVICFCLLWIKGFSQSFSEKMTAFGEIGGGYVFNAESPYWYEISEGQIISSYFFSHGLSTGVHGGLLLNSKINVGLASRFNMTYFLSHRNAAKKFISEKYVSENPSLRITTQGSPFFRFSSLEIGPILNIPFQNWSIDVEMLFGYSSLALPHLFMSASISSNRNPEEFYLLMYRPRQKITYRSINPNLGARFSLSENKYWFMRGEFYYGKTEESFQYELYPKPVPHTGLRMRAEDQFLLGISAGIGISIR